MIIPGVLLLFVVIAVAGSGGSDTSGDPAGQNTEAEGDQSDQEAPEEAGDEVTTTGIGSPARDGRFEFTVHSFECGLETVGEDMFQEEAQGQVRLIAVRVENIGG